METRFVIVSVISDKIMHQSFESPDPPRQAYTQEKAGSCNHLFNGLSLNFTLHIPQAGVDYIWTAGIDGRRQISNSWITAHILKLFTTVLGMKLKSLENNYFESSKKSQNCQTCKFDCISRNLTGNSDFYFFWRACRLNARKSTPTS